MTGYRSSHQDEGEEVELNDEKKSDGDSEPEEVAEDETSRETDGTYCESTTM